MADHAQLLSDRLFEAIENNDIDKVRICIEQNVDLKKRCSSKDSDYYSSPLAFACSLGQEEIVDALLKAGADPNQVSGRYHPVIHLAARRRVIILPMLQSLISHEADVNTQNYAGKTILHYLVKGHFNDTDNNSLSAIKMLLDNGASCYARDHQGDIPLFCACCFGNCDVVKLFIAEGADVNFEIHHMTMLKLAANRGKCDMFDVLLNAGANRHLAADCLIRPCERNDHAMIAKILDTCNVDINMTLERNSDMNLLMHACDNRYITTETVRLLLGYGADVATVSGTGNTVMHRVVRCFDCKKICHLLSYKPRLNIKNNDNLTPLEKLCQYFFFTYTETCLQNDIYRKFTFSALHRLFVLTFKMLVIAGAEETVQVKHELNQFRVKHPEAQIPDYEISFPRSLKEMCRLVIRERIAVPVDVSVKKLPIPNLIQEYLNFSEFDPLIDEYLKIIAND